MTHTLAKMIGKTNDYKLCTQCNQPNWYENKECRHCVYPQSKTFHPIGEGVLEYIEEDYKFYKEDGYNEDFIDNITVEV